MRKIVLFLATGVFLNSCTQYSSLIGPSYTIATTGNVVQAGISYHSSSVIKKQIGKNAFDVESLLFKTENKQTNIDENLIALIETNIKETRKKIFSKN
tara:strand:- start:110 stop:403 length:294 start_codon:yes stop_codon:yes gene_type:complete